MLTILNSKISGFQYNKLILYAKMRCDAFSVCIPDFQTKMSSETRSEEFTNYQKAIAWRFERFLPPLIKMYVSNEYFESYRDSYQEIRIYSLVPDSSASDFLFGVESLYDWKYPNLPEDLCLFSRGKCWLRSIAHEKLCYIYDAGEVEKDIIKKVIGLKFRDDGTEDTNAPLLEIN